MDDDKILARGGDEHDIEEYAKANGADLTKEDVRPITGYGIKPDGTRVDINSPDFKIQEFKSVTFTQEITMEEYNKIYKPTEITKNE